MREAQVTLGVAAKQPRDFRHTLIALDDAPADWRADHTIDATGLVVCPGLIDLSARLREPGFEYKARLESEILAQDATCIIASHEYVRNAPANRSASDLRPVITGIAIHFSMNSR